MSDTSLVRLTLDLSPDDGSAGILVGFIGMPSAHDPDLRFGTDPTGRRRALLESLARLFGAPAGEPTDSVKQDGVASRISRAASPPHRRGC